MAKEKEEKESGKSGAKPKRMHLKRIVTEEAEDGTHVHHHTYMKDKHKPETEQPERRNSATSQNAEEAGQHVAEQFGMNQQQPGGADPGAGGDEEAAAAGGAAPGGAGAEVPGE